MFFPSEEVQPCGVLLIRRRTGEPFYVSETYTNLTGYAQDQLLWDMSGYIVAEDRDEIERILSACTEPHQDATVNYRIKHRDGSIANHLLSACVVLQNGEPMLRCAVFDLTDKMRYERQLAHINHKLETLIANIPGGVFHYRITDTIQVDFISDGMLDLIGCTREQFWNEYQGKMCRFIHPDDRSSVLRDLKECKPIAGESERLEYRILACDGTVRWLMANRQVIPGEQEDLESYIIAVDVTEAYTIRQQFEDIANAIPGGVARIRLDAQLHILYMTDGFCHLFQRSRTEFEQEIGDEAVSLIFPEDIPRIHQIAAPMRGGRTSRFELRILRKDGSTAWIHVVGKQIPGTEDVYQGVFIDITDEKQAQQELKYEKERYRILLDCMDDVTYDYDIAKDCVTFFYRDASTREPQEGVVEQFSQAIRDNNLVAPEYQQLFLQFLCAEIPSKPQEVLLSTPDNESGDYFWHEIRGVSIRDRDGNPMRHIGVLRNIDRQKRETIRLQYKSERDSLTRLYNKAAVYANITDYLEGDGRGCVSAMLMVDFDDFKDINDTLGHQCGDAVLSGLGNGMQRLFRGSDIVGRIGGDEFLIFMKNLPDEKVIGEKATALCEMFRQMYDAQKVSISASIGISVYPRDGHSCEELLRKADLALYSAKRQGKDCYEFYMLSQSMDVNSMERGCATKKARSQALPASDSSMNFMQTVIGLLYPQQNRSESVAAVLELLGQYCGAGRAYLLRATQRDDAYRNAYEWCAPGVCPVQDMSDKDSLENYAYAFDANNLFYLRRSEELEQENPSLSAQMESQNIFSTLQYALRQDGVLLGVIGLDDCMEARLWTKREINILTMIGKLLAICLTKDAAEHRT